MVSSDLRIRRFSPMADQVMNLIPGDVGRPIGDIKPKMALPDIEEVISEVIETVTAKELVVKDAQGRPYSVRIRPYKTADNRIDGAVIVFMDGVSAA
jgi:two-component system CheB/CheR fusion protein